jgi:hypothetical protein
MARSALLRTAALCGGAVLLSLSSSPSARAEEPGPKVHSVAVLGIESDDAEEQAEALTTTLRTKVRASAGWSLGEASQSLGILTAALKCPQRPDAPCEGRIAEQIKSDRFVWGSMRKGGNGKVNVELHFYEKGKPDISASASYSENLKDQNDDSLRREAQAMLAKLQTTSVGTVTVRSSQPDGDVTIDGTRKEALKGGMLKVELASGAHTFDTNSGGSTEHKTVEVVGGKNVEVGAGPAPVTDGDGPTFFTTRHVVGIGAGVVGVGAAVTSIVMALNYQDLVSKMNDKLTFVKPGVDAKNTCNDKGQAANACEFYNSNNGTAQTYSGLAWAFGGLAVAGIGASVYLLVVSPGNAESAPAPKTGLGSVQFVPQMGKTGGSMSVTGSF